MNRLQLFLAGAFALAWGSSAFAALNDRTVGNGGDVVVCKSGKNSAQTVELLDFFEARVMRSIQPDLGDPSLAVKAKVHLALHRLAKHSSERASRYREWADSFLDESLFLTDTKLTDVSDSGYVPLPNDCEIRQIVIQRHPRFPEDKRYLIDKTLWNQLDHDNKAGLILHEAIYREAIEQGHENSIAARYFNSYVVSDRLEQMNLDQFLELQCRLPFFTSTFNGVSIETCAYEGQQSPFLEFFASGRIKSGWVRGSNYKYSYSYWSVPLKLVHFGRTAEVYPVKKIKFYESGNIQELCLAFGNSLTTFESPTYRLTFNSGGNRLDGEERCKAPTLFHENGFLMQIHGVMGWIKKGSKWVEVNNPIVIKIDQNGELIDVTTNNN